MITRIPQLLDQEKNYQLHRRKIENIMSKTNPILDSKRDLIMNKFLQQKDKSTRFSYRQKLAGVQKQNDLILKKIISVSNRKNKTLERTQSDVYTSNSTIRHNNYVNLKKQTDQIAQQNQRLAQKLLRSKSTLVQKKMTEQYYEHLKRKDMLTKFEYNPDIGQIKLKKLKAVQKIIKPKFYGGETINRGNNFSRITQQQNQGYQ